MAVPEATYSCSSYPAGVSAALADPMNGFPVPVISCDRSADGPGGRGAVDVVEVPFDSAVEPLLLEQPVVVAASSAATTSAAPASRRRRGLDGARRPMASGTVGVLSVDEIQVAPGRHAHRPPSLGTAGIFIPTVGARKRDRLISSMIYRDDRAGDDLAATRPRPAEERA